MRTLAKMLVLYCAAFAELHVHAAEHTEKVVGQVIELPKQCWGHRQPCSVQNVGANNEVVKVDRSLVTLSPQTILQQTKKDEFRLIDGKVLFSGVDKSQLSTHFARIQCAGKCLAIVQREIESVRILALEGNLLVTRLGDSKQYNLPQGFWVRMAGVESDGSGTMDFPQSLPLQPTLKEYAQLFSGKWSQFHKEAYRIAPLWTKAVETASQWHLQEARRRIASHQKELALAQDERRKRDSEDRGLREIFRERNYFTK